MRTKMPPFDFVVGDCVEIVKGRSIGVKGFVTQVRKSALVVRTTRASYCVRATSIVLRKKSDMRRKPDIDVESDAIAEFIQATIKKQRRHMINLGEWRRLQKLVEKKLFDIDK